MTSQSYHQTLDDYPTCDLLDFGGICHSINGMALPVTTERIRRVRITQYYHLPLQRLLRPFFSGGGGDHTRFHQRVNPKEKLNQPCVCTSTPPRLHATSQTQFSKLNKPTSHKPQAARVRKLTRAIMMYDDARVSNIPLNSSGK